ncbi:UNVERIFIED_CONTAM: hypothetical protein Sindi_1820500 [Sesamum indicum]
MEILDKCDNGPKRIDPKLLAPEEKQEWLRNFKVRQLLPGNAVKRIHTTKVHGRIPTRRNRMELEPDTSKISQDLREIQKAIQTGANQGHPWNNTSPTPEGEGHGDSKAEITPALPPPEGSTCSNAPPQDQPMREIADFNTNATPTFVGTRLKENPGRNPKRVPENTPWARTMLQPLHPYGTILNLDIIDFRNTEKLIDEWVAAINIAATTLELDKEHFIKLVELSLEGSVKIGWDNTPKDTKASILAGDSKEAIADQLGRLIKIHFIGDGYFEGSRAEKAREYAQALFSLELRSICAVDEYIYWVRKYFFQSGVATEVAAPMFFAKICSPWREMLIQSYKENLVSQGKGGVEEPFPGGDYGGPSPKPEHINLDREQDQQGFHPKDLDETMQDPMEEPLQEELLDETLPEPMKVLKTAIAGLAEQKDIYLLTTSRNMVKPRMIS